VDAQPGPTRSPALGTGAASTSKESASPELRLPGAPRRPHWGGKPESSILRQLPGHFFLRNPR
jgi:hypothetical protein